MKYLKYYTSHNEALVSFTPVSNLLINLLSTLGIKIQKNERVENNITYDVVYVCMDIAIYKKSIIYQLLKAMHPSIGPDEVYIELVYNRFNTEYFAIKINDIDSTESDWQSFKAYTPEGFYKKLIDALITLYSNNNGKLNYNATTHLPDGPYLIETQLIPNIIINYLKLLRGKDVKRLIKGNYNFDELYKITYECISQDDDNHSILSNLSRYYPVLYNNITKFGDKKDINNSTQMGNLGF